MKVAARANGAPSSRSGQDVPDPSESFDQSMQELEALIEQMENGRLPLEASLSAYERGVTLLKRCRDKLAAVTQQVEVLEAGLLVPYEAPEEAGSETGDAEGGTMNTGAAAPRTRVKGRGE